MLPHWSVSLEGGPRRVNHSAALVSHQIFMFGGYCMGEDYEVTKPIDVHVFNTYSYRWSVVPTSLTFDDILDAPYMRYGHSSVAIDNRVYLWGGRNDSKGACNELFLFKTDRLKWSRVQLQGEYPGARDGHAMCVVSGNIYIFGGYEQDLDCFSNDLFMIDVKQKQWHHVKPKAGVAASWRDFHTITSHKHLIYVFGGRGDVSAPLHSNREIYDNTLKVFDTSTNSWSEPARPLTPHPRGRRSHSAFMHKGCLHIFCGYNSDLEQHFNCLWKFDPESSLWEEVRTLGRKPVARRRQCCAVYNDKLFMFGGTSPGVGFMDDDSELVDHNDTHVLDFAPTLRTLSALCVIKHGLDLSRLSQDVRWEIKMMTTPNVISKSLTHG